MISKILFNNWKKKIDENWTGNYFKLYIRFLLVHCHNMINRERCRIFDFTIEENYI